MKTNRFFAYMIMAAAVCACQKENVDAPKTQDTVFTACVEQPAVDTKATLEDGMNVSFSVNDRIRVGYPIVASDGKVTIGGKKECRCTVGGAKGATFTFHADLPADQTCYYAIYPYNPASPEGYSFGKICNLDPGTSPYEFKANGNIHPVQVAVLNGADPAVLGMLGKAGADKVLRFSQMSSLVKFELKKDGVAKVVLTAQIEIAGQYNVQGQDSDGDGWFDTFGQGTNNTDKSTTITLLPPVDNATFPQGVYYIATRPGRNCTNGLSLTFYDASDTEMKTFSNSKTVKLNRGKIRFLGSFTW